MLYQIFRSVLRSWVSPVGYRVFGFGGLRFRVCGFRVFGFRISGVGFTSFFRIFMI